MLYRAIAKIIGSYLLIFSVVLLIPLFVASYYEYSLTYIEHPQAFTTKDFLITIGITLFLACLFLWFGKSSGGVLYKKEGIAAVVLIWFLTPAIGAIPFLTSGTLENPFQAYFEMVSGFTTTGATTLQAKAYNENGEEVPIVVTIPGMRSKTYSFYGTVNPIRDESGKIIKEGVEAIGKGLLFWRGFSQWLGGGGIIVLLVAVLPALGIGGKVLFQSEVAGPDKEGTTPRIKETAWQLWKIYLVLTLIQVACLLYFDRQIPFFESLLVTFSTISTGGLSTQNTSIAGYQSSAVEWVVIVFMILGSVNFSLYYAFSKGKFYKFFNPELILYFCIIAIFGGLTVYSIWGSEELLLNGQSGGIFTGVESIRTGLFQMVSALSTTGFSTSNYDIWPYSAQVLMLIAMYVGGMAGSTAGGIKIIRHYMMFFVAQNRVESLFRQEHVRILKIQGKEVDSSITTNVLCFFLIVVATACLGTTLYVFDHIDLETAISLTANMQNNTGMSFRMAGPAYSVAFLSDFSLLLSCLLMIFGRLEYLAVLCFLVPAFWKKDS